jgi:hypothetical protein
MNRECVLNSKPGMFHDGLSNRVVVKNRLFSMCVGELIRRIWTKWEVFRREQNAKRNRAFNQMASAYYLHNLP